MARDAAWLRLEPDQGPAGSLRLDLLQRVAADEVAFGQLHGPAEPGFVRVHCLVHIVAVEAEGSLESRRIAGAQARGQDPGGLPGLEDGVPDMAEPVAGDEELEAVLAGVTGARDDRSDACDLAAAESEVRDIVRVLVGRQDLGRTRALKSDQAEVARVVCQRHVAR